MGKPLSRERRNTLLGLAFLSPNILGFLAFTVIPLVFSFFLAFTNWDLKLHNAFKNEPIQFAFLSNFLRLLRDGEFYQYLGNTLFLMMNIPLAIAGSLGAALLLSKDMRGGSPRVRHWLIVSAALLLSVAALCLVGLHAGAFVILLSGLAGLMLFGGVLGGSTLYRTVFFIPHFTSGVAVFILWKKLYNPSNGPVNNALARPLLALGRAINATPPGVIRAGLAVSLALAVALALWGLTRLLRMSRDGALGTAAAALPLAMLLAPCVAMALCCPHRPVGRVVGLLTLAVALGLIIAECLRGRDFPARPSQGFGDAFMLALLLMLAQLILLGLGSVAYGLPEQAADGLEPPAWLSVYDWAKPAIMIMGLWGAIGSNNMLLYLAGLSNIPAELYEAADIDGASRFQRFWHITWPQLAPVTFFIFIMSVIGGLQGGFEMARTMTNGGPAGSTTTLSYFIYTQGFSTGRLGYASGIAWVLFAMVFTVTLFNWKFGSRYVND
ncbi:MAG: sugar ABC transporter permease [Lentisphaeria bacterium]|nr:sugar ABC transporter permease [Lentisphaeria bacterium]